MPKYKAIENVKFKGCWIYFPNENRLRKCVSDFSNEVHIRLSIAVQSGVRDMNGEVMKLCCKMCHTNPSQ